MYNLLIIGVGQLGSRHLQGLALLNCDANIYVVDKCVNSLTAAKERYEIVQRKRNINLHVVYLTDILLVPESIDVAIISTTSDMRKDIVVSLIENKKVAYLILEKVLFNRLKDYSYIQNLLSKNQIKTWVNCSRRTIDIYQQLKLLFENEDYIQITVEGANWGLGCNAVHFIDLLSYISDCKSNLKVDMSKIDEEMIPSRRSGFVEFTGELSGSFDINNTFKLVSRAEVHLPEILLEISSPNYKVTINEEKEKMIIKRKSNKWEEECFYIMIPFQSHLTNRVVEEILIAGDCQLPTYEESMYIHIPIIKGFALKCNKEDIDECICNIT